MQQNFIRVTSVIIQMHLKQCNGFSGPNNLHILLYRSYRSIYHFNSISFDSQSKYFVVIMLRQVTPEKVIHIVWLSAALSFCWPLPISSSRTRVLGFRILQISAIISACMLLLPMLYSIYLHLDDLVVVFKCMCMSTALCQLIVQTTMCWIKQDSLQVSFYLLTFGIQCKQICILTTNYSVQLEK